MRIEVLGYSIMSSHLHAILRNRPDVVKTWSDEEVSRRWWNLFPSRRSKDGSPAEPAETDLKSSMANAKVRAELRARLSSMSWFMRCASEVIARMANAEEECTGRFWEGRLKSQILLDDAAILACLQYVDLNPVRVKISTSPESSDFTSAQDRNMDLKAAEEISALEEAPSSGLSATYSPDAGEKGQSEDARDDRVEHGVRAGWLAPIPLEPKR